MGCCFSTSTNNTKTSPPSKTPNNNSKSPPLLLEEETVKEVLSESIPKPITDPNPFTKPAPILRTELDDEKKHKNDAVLPTFTNEEVSEICSNISENVSVSTTPTEKKENQNDDVFHEVRQRPPAVFKNRSFSGELKRERTGPSPGRVRPGSGSGSGPGTGYGRKREDSSGRRSRSPVTREKPSLVRSDSSSKTGKLPGRVGSGLGERVRKMEEGKKSGDSQCPPLTSDESLENPLVSLECFIFL